MAGKMLVNSPKAVEFIDFMSLQAGRTSQLGDSSQFSDVHPAFNALNNANAQFEYVLPKIKGLVEDTTRTLPQRHDAARQFANRTEAVLNDTRATLLKEAQNAHNDALEIIESNFAPNPMRASIQSEIRGWIRSNADTEGGIGKIREALERNSEVAAVIHHSPDFLLGIGENTRSNMAVSGVEAHLPNASKLMLRSAALSKVAEAYPQIIRSVHASFYSAGVADQMSSRIEA
jgi:hypothetical protein